VAMSCQSCTIDGTTLAELMIDHGVGVTIQHQYEVKRLDLDYFVEDEALVSQAQVEQ
jgi:restriction endonuclease Mrr